MCCSAACAFHPVVLSLNQNSSSAHPLLPRCRPIINHCCPIWHPRRGPQAVLSRFSTNPGWSHRPELQLSTSTTPPLPPDYQPLLPHLAPTPRTSSCTFSIQHQPRVVPQARTPAQHIPYLHTRTSSGIPTPTTNPGNDYSNRSNQGNLRNWHACRDRCRPQTRPSRQSSSAVPLPHSFSFNQHISSWQELAHKPTHQSSSHMTKRAMLVA